MEQSKPVISVNYEEKFLYMQEGTTFRPTSKESLNLHDKLPVGNYTVGFSPLSGFYLQSAGTFENPHKLYGNIEARADRIINTFNHRPNNTGVMLNGEKGTGKTLLAKVISQKLANSMGMSTLVINNSYTGDQFNRFLSNIEPCLVIFDEFEKVFDEEDQEKILTLLDGTFPQKKLFIITCNDKFKVNEHMKNRPGRLFYAIDYGTLDMSFVRDYCKDNLINKAHIEQVCNVVSAFSKFNFDMLKALVEEMNRYGETAVQAIELLNAKPSYSDSDTYTTSVSYNGRDIDPGRINHSDRHEVNPAISEITIYIEEDYSIRRAKRAISNTPADAIESVLNEMQVTEEEVEDPYYAGNRLHLDPSHITKMDANDGVVEYKNEGYTVKLTKKRYHEYRAY